ncbi:hypothetical protein CRUP_030333 [Coryphaenoides rupestris]|nr:hypothetical protein CRUP_030333 [Coryphaenoides rupestris]
MSLSGSITVHTAEAAASAGEPGEGISCEVDPSVFEPPADYATLGPGRSEPMRDEDDNLLQFAIQQSLLDAGTESDQVTIWEALTNSRPVPSSSLYEDDCQLERAIQESLSITLPAGEAGGVADDRSQSSSSASPVDLAAVSPPSYSTLAEHHLATPPQPPTGLPISSFDEQLRLAMELSCREQEEIDRLLPSTYRTQHRGLALHVSCFS